MVKPVNLKRYSPGSINRRLQSTTPSSCRRDLSMFRCEAGAVRTGDVCFPIRCRLVEVDDGVMVPATQNSGSFMENSEGGKSGDRISNLPCGDGDSSCILGSPDRGGKRVGSKPSVLAQKDGVDCKIVWRTTTDGVSYRHGHFSSSCNSLPVFICYLDLRKRNLRHWFSSRSISV